MTAYLIALWVLALVTVVIVCQAYANMGMWP